MHHSRRTPAAATVAVALGALLSACGPSTPPAPTSAPDVTATVTSPEGWERTGQDDPLVALSQTPYGDPGFTANVVVTTSAAGTATLADRVAEAAEVLETADDVTTDPTQAGAITAAGLPAYRLGATRTVDGVQVTQVETIVEVSTPRGTAFAYVTESYATDDTQGAVQARAVTDSLVVTPTG